MAPQSSVVSYGISPVRTIRQWRRARAGDRVIVVVSGRGRRFFVSADDLEVGIRIPIYATVQFDRPFHVGGKDNTKRNRHICRIPIVLAQKKVTRLALQALGDMVFLHDVRTSQRATVKKLPRPPTMMLRP